MRSFFLRLTFLLLVSVSLAAVDDKSASSTSSGAPSTAARPVTDDYFGNKILDPYRWLEDLKSPEVSAWMKAENDHTRSVLDRIPG